MPSITSNPFPGSSTSSTTPRARPLVHDAPPPDTAWAEASALASLEQPSSPEEPSHRLSAVPSTLAIPLAARAEGDRLFPRWAVQDAEAPRLLKALGIDPRPFLAHRAGIFGVLSRTHRFRQRASDHFARHPGGIGVVLGAGLSHYFQWLDNGRNIWIDADLPEVTHLRKRWLPCEQARRMNASLDITQPGWWHRLGLPGGREGPPVLLLAEGLVMYLRPAQVQAMLWAVGEFAPAGSRLLLDALAWPAVGRAALHPSVRHTEAQFQFGLRRAGELAAAHPRLRLDAVHTVMEPYGLPYKLVGPAMKFLLGVPLYAVYELGVEA